MDPRLAQHCSTKILNTTTRIRTPPQTNWQIPAIGIERLLQLSTSIPIPVSELTPVQAWHLLRQHPDFGGLDLARLRALMETLIKDVKYYG